MQVGGPCGKLCRVHRAENFTPLCEGRGEKAFTLLCLEEPETENRNDSLERVEAK